MALVPSGWSARTDARCAVGIHAPARGDREEGTPRDVLGPEHAPPPRMTYRHARGDELVAAALRPSRSAEPAPFDLPQLDAIVGEVARGDLLLVGGHPGAPTDALVLRAALAAARRGEPTTIVSPAASTRAVANWLLSTTGLPLDVLWAGRAPTVVVDTLTESFHGLPLWLVEGKLDARGLAEAVVESRSGNACLAVLGLRWVDPREHMRLVLFELAQVTKARGLRTFASVDTRFPGPNACENPLRPDLFTDPSMLTLADTTLLLTASWVFWAGHARTFDAAVVAPAARIGVAHGLINPRNTMQILEPEAAVALPSS